MAMADASVFLHSGFGLGQEGLRPGAGLSAYLRQKEADDDDARAAAAPRTR